MSALRARVGEPRRRCGCSRSTRRPSSCATGSTPTAIRRSPATRTSPTGRSRSKATSSRCTRCTRCCCRAGARRPGTRDTEVIRLFPATSARWHDASFDDLRAEGGYRRLRPARKQRHHLVPHRRPAARACCACATTSAAARRRGAGAGVRKVGANYEVRVKAGDMIEADRRRRLRQIAGASGFRAELSSRYVPAALRPGIVTGLGRGQQVCGHGYGERSSPGWR